MKKETRAGRLNPTSTIARILLACGVVAGSAAYAEYLAYAVVDGARSPLPESIDAVEASYLVDLEWDYRGGRSMIEIRPVEDERGSGAGDVSLAGIGEAVAEAIRRTGRFVVDDSGTATESGADGYVLHVALADYAVQVAESVTNPRAVRSRSRPTERGRFAIDLRLVDAAGRAVVTGQFEAAVSEPRPGVAGFGEVEGLGSDIWTESIGQAILAAVNKGAFEIVRAVGPLPLSGRVVRADGDRVWINLGRGSVSVGDTLEVTSAGESLVDPETGLDLGVLEETVGTVQVSRVEDRFSIAEALSIMTPPNRGDSVRSVSPQAEFMFATDWNPP
ncbi:MAG: hypothetical protein OXP28_14080 [Gammaproteobacteria bacterium]|nr:hypothetical protein [Gammaproteobacteria bacterium]MDE0226242.1 hypothetical protein [Gammaproteobacteria bacterium]